MYHPASMFISSVLISTDVLTRKFLLYDINSGYELSTIWSVCYVIPLFYCAILLMCFIHILFSLYNSYSYVSSKLDFSLAQRWCLFNVIWIFSLYPESASCSTVQYTEKNPHAHLTSLVWVWKETDMSKRSFLCSTLRTKSWIRTSRCRAAL